MTLHVLSLKTLVNLEKCSLYHSENVSFHFFHGMINKKTYKLEKHAEGFQTAQLELCPFICIYRALSIQESQSALQTRAN